MSTIPAYAPHSPPDGDSAESSPVSSEVKTAGTDMSVHDPTCAEELAANGSAAHMHLVFAPASPAAAASAASGFVSAHRSARAMVGNPVVPEVPRDHPSIPHLSGMTAGSSADAARDLASHVLLLLSEERLRRLEEEARGI